MPNAQFSKFNNLGLLRATRQIERGEEITFSYLHHDIHLDHPTKKCETLAGYGVTCSCLICRAEERDGAQVLARRVEYANKVERLRKTLAGRKVFREEYITVLAMEERALRATYQPAIYDRGALVPKHQLAPTEGYMLTAYMQKGNIVEGKRYAFRFLYHLGLVLDIEKQQDGWYQLIVDRSHVMLPDNMAHNIVSSLDWLAAAYTANPDYLYVSLALSDLSLEIYTLYHGATQGWLNFLALQ
jgi:hypothetical protein